MAALMLQGCGSDVGKSVLVAGLCRLFANRGLAVRPFKPQNMSNNAAVTTDGGEIGRAQALQALACRAAPTVDMNPVLIKPQSDRRAQVVVRGRMLRTQDAATYQGRKGELLGVVLDSYRRLAAECDLVLVEGAGSPAEINLRAGDIANMGFALAARVPVVLVGDIDRGHVIAALAGAKAVLAKDDLNAIHGFIINKFRGDPELFTDGRRAIVELTGWPDLGMVPWLAAASHLPAEDAVTLERPGAADAVRRLKIIVPMLSRIANFDDFDPLRAEPEVALTFIPPGQPMPGDADLVILPGTKATLADLAFLRAQGWDVDLAAHVRRGGRVLGVCGGYQMLGRRIADPHGIEGPAGEAAGLGLLDVDTVLTTRKTLTHVAAEGFGARLTGYEMHVGVTTGPGLQHPFLHLDGEGAHGACSLDGRIMGGYVHGLFEAGAFRAAFLGRLGARSRAQDHGARVDQALDEIAAELARHLDIATLARIAGLETLPT
ncbi:MAG TPA: cobyric acid synthase [Phenylobacterium sp.]|uniref:cobyric acid synthase n=1 Tax=Phenylobacterium sp. TaxID=1871053 RepID=UPI002B483AFF|nr:cobyric acid synthase [Phenylobacterium sp.]HKR86553.1 cobyric acid synthase [Phenylobacterium sp.]